MLQAGQSVGVSTYLGDTSTDRKFLSLACVDAAPAELGTEGTVIWGEENSPKPNVERHAETEILAAVAPVQNEEDRREFVSGERPPAEMVPQSAGYPDRIEMHSTSK